MFFKSEPGEFHRSLSWTGTYPTPSLYFKRVEQKYPEFFFETDDFIWNRGYPAEEYEVITEDGYILRLFRILCGKDWSLCNVGTRRTPVLVMHGLLGSSDVFAMNYANRSFCFLMADAGYDVWLGNFRGTHYTLNHLEPVPSHHDFFQFSLDEMAMFDLPATIDYVLNVTGYKNLQLIGHSMGATVSFAMLAALPKYNKKVAAYHALGPVVYLTDIKGVARTLVPFVNVLMAIFHLFDYVHFSPNNWIVKLVAVQCDLVLKPFCISFFALTIGYDIAKVKSISLPVVVSHIPAGSSTNTMHHYGQLALSKKFQQYDYGPSKNLIIYGTKLPPEYQLKRVTAPVHIYWAADDVFAGAQDMELLRQNLPNCVDFHEVMAADFSHMNFVWGNDETVTFSKDLISKLVKYRALGLD